MTLVAARQWRLKGRCVDSESRLLAIKKFSPQPGSRLNAARQNRFFASIAAADSGAADFASGDASPLLW
jgi:hypothetical protein